MSSRPLRSALILLYAVALGVVLYLAIDGSSYYSTPLQERPRHEDYWDLKPGGSKGHVLGIAGAALMVMMLVYSVRKRVPAARRLGQLSSWLHFHIFCGIVGPLLVILHSSFKVQGLVALSFWSMIIVALSGFAGRYLYVQIPRRRSGDELTLRETQELDERLGERLAEEFHLSPELLEELDRIATGRLEEKPGLLRVLIWLPWWGLASRWRLRGFEKRLSDLPRSVRGELMRTLVRKATLERRIRMWNELQRLFYYWHLFHKPFAVIMYLFMVVHIAVAVATGYGVF